MTIIAEIGINHLGNMGLALRMIKEAKDAGADLVKSQLYNAEDDKDKLHYQYSKQAELNYDQAKHLFDYAADIGIEMFFSVFGVKYVEWCEKIGVKRYKIACGMRDKDVWQAISRTGKRAIVSYNTAGTFPYGILATMIYCVPEYPATFSMLDFEHNDVRFNGFSDHTIGLDAAKIALARGAQIIEKHFILDRNSPSPDAPWSMTPDELRELKRWETVCKEVL